MGWVAQDIVNTLAILSVTTLKRFALEQDNLRGVYHKSENRLDFQN